MNQEVIKTQCGNTNIQSIGLVYSSQSPLGALNLHDGIGFVGWTTMRKC